MANLQTETRDISGHTSHAVSKTLDMIALILMIIGGLNWGLVALFNFDLVATLFGPMSTGSRVVYLLVSLAAIWGIVTAVHVARPER